MPTYKTPDVYVEEISIFPPSVAQVETAVPAFIGYTQRAWHRGSDLTGKPTRIDSLLEFEARFGGAPKIAIDEVILDDNNGVVETGFNARFYLYDSLRLFYSNGGGKCYIVSVGDYDHGPPQFADLKGGLEALEKQDEPTLILFPDAMLLANEDQLYTLQQLALNQCNALGDRFAIFDLSESPTWEEGIEAFRNKIGINYLKYGAAYTPHLQSTLPLSIRFRDIEGKLVKSGALAPLATLTSDPQIQEAIARAQNALRDTDLIEAGLEGFLATQSADSIRDGYQKLVLAFKTAPSLNGLKSLFTYIYDIADELFDHWGESTAADAGDAVIVLRAAVAEAQAKAVTAKNFHANASADPNDVQAAIQAAQGAADHILNLASDSAALAQRAAEAVAQADSSADTTNLLGHVGLADSTASTARVDFNNDTDTAATPTLTHQDILDAIDDALSEVEKVAASVAAAAREAEKLTAGLKLTGNSAESVANYIRNLIDAELRDCIKLLNSITKDAAAKVGGNIDLYTDDTKYVWSASEWNDPGVSDPDPSIFNPDNITAATGIYPNDAPAGNAGKQTENMIAAEPHVSAVFNKLNQAIIDILATARVYEQKYEESLAGAFPLYRDILSKVGGALNTLPPSGAVAGVYASVDRNRGVWKAPANLSLNAVAGLTHIIDSRDQEELNVDVNAGKSINAIRAFTGRGILVWGARTLAGNDNEWRYISVRRFYNMVEESSKKSTYWAVFEPNDANLWIKVKSMLENFLTSLWKDGALAGATTEQAYFVNVGLGTTMSAQDILEGRMIVEIGMAVVRPAEFIILRFSHKLQES